MLSTEEVKTGNFGCIYVKLFNIIVTAKSKLTEAFQNLILQIMKKLSSNLSEFSINFS